MGETWKDIKLYTEKVFQSLRSGAILSTSLSGPTESMAMPKDN